MEITKEQLQADFDKSVEYLLNNPLGRSESSEGGCSYLREDGNRCVIGNLMTLSELEEYGGSQDYVCKLARVLHRFNHKVYEDLQRIHDQNQNWFLMDFIGQSKLSLVARRHNLRVPKELTQ